MEPAEEVQGPARADRLGVLSPSRIRVCVPGEFLDERQEGILTGCVKGNGFGQLGKFSTGRRLKEGFACGAWHISSRLLGEDPVFSSEAAALVS